MCKFEGWTNREIANYIFERCNNEQIREFCGLSVNEYVDGINRNNDFLFEMVISTIEQMPDDIFNSFIDSIE